MKKYIPLNVLILNNWITLLTEYKYIILNMAQVKVLEDKYVLGRFIGEGAYGWVTY